MVDERRTPLPMEHLDVVIVGAGISGVGSACHLLHQRPGRSFVVLEALESFGGTWLVHRFPGARSDSDLYTFGYRFKPWTGAPIASSQEILKYMGEVIDEHNLSGHIRYHHRMTSASWSSEANVSGNRCHAYRHRPAVAFYRWFFMDVPGLLPPCRRVHTSVARDGTLSGPHRPPPTLAG